MKINKGVSIGLIALNVIGVICLIYLAIPYLTHNTTVVNPDAMLPCEAWDGAGMCLTIGLAPLLAANILGFLFVGSGKRYVRLLFFVPSVICLAIVGSYWLWAA